MNLSAILALIAAGTAATIHIIKAIKGKSTDLTDKPTDKANKNKDKLAAVDNPVVNNSASQ
jgi:hypothetical protein